MTHSHEVLFQELQHIRSKLREVKKNLKSLDSYSSRKQYSCVTFTAINGSSTMSQLNNEIKILENKLSNRVSIRNSQGNPLNQDQRRRILSTNAVLSDFIKKESKNVKNGMVRQYFVNETMIVTDPVEFPLENLNIRIRKGDAASSYHLLRQKKFNTASLENYANYLNRKETTIHSELANSVKQFILKSGEVGFPTNLWSESATDLSSDGGFLISTQPNTDYQILFCPFCSEKLIEQITMAYEGGSIGGVVLPPIPLTILNLNVFCTENLHKEHTIEDCIEISELESKINSIREKFGAGIHSTEAIRIEDEQLSESHGPWLWLKFNQSL